MRAHRITRRRILAQAAAAGLVSVPAEARPVFLRGGSLPPSASAPPDNVMLITNVSGGVLTNWPLQFGRPFVAGEIPNYPQVLIGGSPVTTQADVKNRHQNGSVKFAIMAIIIPSMPAARPITITFQDQPNGNNAPISAAQMLDASYNFDISMRISFTSGAISTASARAMLAAGDYKLWTSGQIAQTVEIADDTAARKYDIGNGNGFRPFRPRFFATFWPALNKVKVRVVAENGLTMEISNLLYIATVTLGSATPQQVYTADLTGGNNRKLHWALTQWTKRFWIGGEPEKMIKIDYNIGYLASTKYVLNYDTSVAVHESKIARDWNYFNAKPNDIYDGKWNGGSWVKSGMSTTGGRPDLGPVPQWCSQWLFSGDWRMREMSLTHADIYASEPMHLLEIDPNRRLNRADPLGSGTGLGHYASAADRHTQRYISISSLGDGGIAVGDQFRAVGPTSPASAFSYDGAHQPAPFYFPYILEGDPYYLREMYAWAAVTALKYNRRGPTGAEGGIEDELRGAGRVFRNRVYAAHAAPDDAPEGPFFRLLALDAIAKWEGGFQILGTVFDGTSVKVYQQSIGDYYSGGVPPGFGVVPARGNWESNGDLNEIQSQVIQGVFKPGVVGSFTSTWMQHHAMEGLAIGWDLGFPVESLMLHTGQWYTNGILKSGNPKIALGTYRMPIQRIGDFAFMSWAEIIDAYTDDYKNKFLPGYWLRNSTLEDRQVAATPAMAALVGMGAPDAAAAWAWFETNVYAPAKAGWFSTVPGFAVRPRT